MLTINDFWCIVYSKEQMFANSNIYRGAYIMKKFYKLLGIFGVVLIFVAASQADMGAILEEHMFLEVALGITSVLMFVLGSKRQQTRHQRKILSKKIKLLNDVNHKYAA